MWYISLTHIQRKMELISSNGWGEASVDKAIFNTSLKSTLFAFLDCALWIFHQEMYNNIKKWVNPYDNVRIYPSLSLPSLHGVPWRLASMSPVDWNIHDDVKDMSDVNFPPFLLPLLQYSTYPSVLLFLLLLTLQK